jgi:hypothetical protein
LHRPAGVRLFATVAEAARTSIFARFRNKAPALLISYAEDKLDPTNRTGDIPMLTKTKIALAAALILSAASAALANDIDQSPSTAQSVRESQGSQLPWWWNVPSHAGAPGAAYGFVAQTHTAHAKVRAY